jgi:hypothetical protein
MNVTPGLIVVAMLLAAPSARADGPPVVAPSARTTPPVDGLAEVERGLRLERHSQQREIVLHHLADPRAPPPPPAPTSHPTWYGWQTLAADAASVVIVSFGLTRTETSTSGGMDLLAPVMIYGGAGAFVLGGPIVHAAHGRWTTAMGDLALRVGAPLVAGVVGYGIASTQVTSLPAYCNDPPAGFQGLGCVLDQVGNDSIRAEGALIGAGTGALVASVLDAAVLAHAPTSPSPVERLQPTLTWSPTVAVRPEGGASAGVVGRF